MLRRTAFKADGSAHRLLHLTLASGFAKTAKCCASAAPSTVLLATLAAKFLRKGHGNTLTHAEHLMMCTVNLQAQPPRCPVEA
jgi:hypothetical protein